MIWDFLDTTNFLTKAAARENGFFAAILRSSAFGSSILAQATALKPDLVTFWLGANDVLGYATSGGTSPAAPTDANIFAGYYSESIGYLHAALPKTKIVVANIPDVDAIPFFTTVGPKIAASLKGVESVNHAVVGLLYEKTARSLLQVIQTSPILRPILSSR